MKQEDAQAVAKYIAQALGKTGINIKLCISRLKHYTHGAAVQFAVQSVPAAVQVRFP